MDLTPVIPPYDSVGNVGDSTDHTAWEAIHHAQHAHNVVAPPPPPPAPDALIDLVCQHRGHVSDDELRRAGFAPQVIQDWLREHLLVHDEHTAHNATGEVGAVHGAAPWYHLAEPDLYIDGLILALWEAPATTPVTIGRLTALEYYGLSVAAVDWIDLAVPEGASLPATASKTAVLGEAPITPSASPAAPAVALAALPPLDLRPFHLPRDLWAFGRTTVTPGLPGTIAIPMYSPAVALAQALADPTMDLDSLTDALLRYLGQWGEDEALQTAVRRYDVVRQLLTTQALLSA